MCFTPTYVFVLNIVIFTCFFVLNIVIFIWFFVLNIVIFAWFFVFETGVFTHILRIFYYKLTHFTILIIPYLVGNGNKIYNILTFCVKCGMVYCVVVYFSATHKKRITVVGFFGFFRRSYPP